MKLPLFIARKILELVKGGTVPASRMRHEAASRLLADGILCTQLQGRRKAVYYVRDAGALSDYLGNHFGIGDLQAYVASLERGPEITRSEAVRVASDSKVRPVRTFKGFPVNCFEPIDAIIGGKPVTLSPQPGLFTFIYDFEAFVPSTDVTVVGVENPECFRFVERQRYLFAGISPLFVSCYPRSGDLLKWLRLVRNEYLHFGDFDFAGIAIFLNEYKRHLGSRARLLVPGNIEMLIRRYGNRMLYDAQLHLAPDLAVCVEPEITGLVALLHKHKKGLEQEILITGLRDQGVQG